MVSHSRSVISERPQHCEYFPPQSMIFRVGREIRVDQITDPMPALKKSVCGAMPNLEQRVHLTLVACQPRMDVQVIPAARNQGDTHLMPACHASVRVKGGV